MIGEAAPLLAEIGAPQLALCAAVAFVAATVSGMSAVGGGLLLAIFIAPIVGVKAVVPTVGIAMLIAHVVRLRVYREGIVWRPALMMLAGAVAATVASAKLYVALPADVVAVIAGIFPLTSVPVRRILARRELRIGSRSLALIGATYDFLAGTTIGGGILVIPRCSAPPRRDGHPRHRRGHRADHAGHQGDRCPAAMRCSRLACS